MAATEPDQVIVRFCELFNQGDLDGLLTDLYEENAVFIPSPTDAPVSGTAALTEVLKGFLGLGGKLSVSAPTTIRDGDVGLTHSRWRLDIPDADPLEGLTAEIVRRQPDGTWKYAIDNPWGGAVLGAGG